MPEIKHNFAGGKMNKDVDERLVPKGEYRDAMNVQVSTSEGSEVGTIQNILGNKTLYPLWNFNNEYVIGQYNQSVSIGSGENSLSFPGYNLTTSGEAENNNQSISINPPPAHKIIGSIADEKNDKFYYFARNSTSISPSFIPTNIAQSNLANPASGYSYPSYIKNKYLRGTGIQVHSDSIVEWDVSKEEHKTVFTDNHTLTFPIWSCLTGEAANYGIHSAGYFLPPPGDFFEHGIGDTNSHINGLVREISMVLDEYLANKFLQVGTHVECWAGNYDSGSTNLSLGATIKSFRKFTEVDPDSPVGLAQGAIAGSTKLAGYIITLSKDIDLTLAFQHPEFLIFKLADSALGLSDEPLTGINIIDDLLFFTNGKTEPKKINIPRCIKGTQRARYDRKFDGSIVIEDNNISYGSSGSRQTLLIVEDNLVPHYSMKYDTTIDGPILDDDYYDTKWLEMSARHTNVIKKKPITKIKTKIGTELRSGPTLGTTEAWTFYSASNVQFEPGTTGDFEIYLPGSIGQNSVSTLAYEIGDVILLLNEADINETTRSLPFNYDVRLLITGIGTAPSARYYYEVLSVGDNAPVPLSVFHTTLETPDNAKYADEMLRFSYRYKYEDRETSAFAPFSDIVFLPGEFKYDNSNVFNAGMENYISKITLEDFIYLPNISDVVGIDILLKYESSPNIYVVETIRREYITENLNPVDDIAGVNFGWFRGSYEFDIDSLKFILPENQLLRSWDNVPTSALAQEIVGNRIVYANYTQSYDISDRAQDSNLLLGTSARKDLGYNYAQYTGSPSVKSQRNYQVGISWIDKEGRESPVITSDSSLIYFNKSLSNIDNLISITNNSIIPDWARSYKYYIKDPKKPNYNFVIDTVYLAETGEYWLSVPSSERNKVEEGDYLEIKKGVESNVAVSKQSEAKIIAIENEAPDFIKTRYRSLGKCKAFMPSTNTNAAGALFNPDDEPVAGKDHFKIYKYTWENELDPGSNFGQGTALAGEGAFDNPEMAVRFVATPSGAVNSNVSGNYRSDLYQVANLTTTGGTAAPLGTYTIKLEKPISENDSWVEDATNPGSVEPTLKLEVFERIIESLPEHEGRFFAKIQGKDDIVNDIVGDNYTFQDEKILYQFPIRNLTDFGNGQQAGLSQADHTTGVALIDPNGTPGFPGSQNTTSNLNGVYFGYDWITDTYEDADSLFRYTEYGINNPLPDYWFIDRMRYKEIQNKNLPNPTQYGGVMMQSGVQGAGKNGYGMGIFQGTADHAYVDPTDPSYHSKLADNPSYAWQVDSSGNGSSSIIEGEIYMEVSNAGMMKTPTGQLDWYNAWNPHYIAYNAGATYNHHADPAQNLDQVTAFTTPGIQFRFRGYTEVFTIMDYVTELKYTYTNGTEYATWCNQAGYTQECDEAKKQLYYPGNRRLTYVLRLDKDPRAYGLFDPTDAGSLNSITEIDLVFIDREDFNLDNELKTTNPAVFEVKNEDTVPVDIYYEASQEIPILLDGGEHYGSDIQSLIKIGSQPYCPGNPDLIPPGTTVLNAYRNQVWLSNELDNLDVVYSNQTKIFFPSPSGGYYASTIVNVNAYGIQTLYPASEVLHLQLSTLQGQVGLDWYNCIAFGNGVESAFLRDDFNEASITKGVRASSTIEETVKKEHKKNGLIYSGLYNTASNINSLNEFITAEKITKDINPTYGSIQKLHTRDTDLITLCEDKILRILANKDAIFNADGNTQLTATQNVLGQTIPFVGEYGISKNPESFASESYRAYFTDKVRGSVMRLSKDGLTAISNHGMKDWFRDNLKLSNKLIGSYDDKKDEYNITLEQTNNSPTTVTFREDVKGWVSFKSFVPENAISCANEYFTFKNGQPWIHHSDQVDRNTFYGTDNVNYTKSSFEVILNDVPGSVKSFKTLNYEGSQAKITKELNDDGSIVDDGNYHNLSNVKGWFVNSFITDLENGTANEFIKKEGKYFTFPTGNDVVVNPGDGTIVSNFDTADFSIQGLGTAVVTNTTVYGCMDITMFNYDPAVDVDNGTCIPFIYGCMDSTADNYIPLIGDTSIDVNTSDGSCVYPGCTNPLSLNYDPNVIVDDGSCIARIIGCTIPGAFNYDSSANTECGGDWPLPPDTTLGQGLNYCCIATVTGCTDPLALNYNSGVNFDDGSCVYPQDGCTDPAACNYDVSATNDDGTCVYCGDPNAVNYSANASATCTSGCLFCAPGFSNVIPIVTTTPATAGMNNGTITIKFNELDYTALSAIQPQYKIIITWINSSNSNQTTILINSSSANTSGWGTGEITVVLAQANYNYIVGWGYDGDYNTSVAATCTDASDPSNLQSYAQNGIITSQVTSATIDPVALGGCMDITECNHNPLATFDDGSCEPAINCTGCADTNYLEACLDCWDPVGLAQVASGGDPWVFTDNSLCTTLIVNGCTTPGQFNFDPLANVDDGSCIAIVYGCMDDSTTAYTNISEEGRLEADGQTDCPPNNPNGSLVVNYPTYSNYVLPQTLPVPGVVNTHDPLLCTPNVYGCYDTLAQNYDPNATVMGDTWPTNPIGSITNDIFAIDTETAHGQCGNPCFGSGLTYVPDDNLEYFIEQNTSSAYPLPDYILTSDVHTLTQFMGTTQIDDFTGIEDAINLTEFYYYLLGAADSLATNINLSNSVNLDDVKIQYLDHLQTVTLPLDGGYPHPGNELLDINISNCSSLTNLNLNSAGKAWRIQAYNNNLTSITLPLLTGNIFSPAPGSSLTWLSLAGNNLTSLDLADASNLTNLYLGGNDIVELIMPWNFTTPNFSNLTTFTIWNNDPTTTIVIKCSLDSRAIAAHNIARLGTQSWSIPSGTIFVGAGSGNTPSTNPATGGPTIMP